MEPKIGGSLHSCFVIKLRHLAFITVKWFSHVKSLCCVVNLDKKVTLRLNFGCLAHKPAYEIIFALAGIITLQGTAKRWALGCVILASWSPSGRGRQVHAT